MTKDYRRCVSCRQLAPRSQLLRIVRCFPSRNVEVDRGDKILQGRSAYICPNFTCLEAAQKKNRLARSLKTPVDQSIYQMLTHAIVPKDAPSSAIETPKP